MIALTGQVFSGHRTKVLIYFSSYASGLFSRCKMAYRADPQFDGQINYSVYLRV